ncbi:hypothetical protein MPSEU_000290600 [Mayamaea pseudoterrestris]|nr:hypothetical protein MPSEU_000290600 [Mayamaea pseudoterrestris]
MADAAMGPSKTSQDSGGRGRGRGRGRFGGRGRGKSGRSGGRGRSDGRGRGLTVNENVELSTTPTLNATSEIGPIEAVAASAKGIKDLTLNPQRTDNLSKKETTADEQPSLQFDGKAAKLPTKKSKRPKQLMKAKANDNKEVQKQSKGTKGQKQSKMTPNLQSMKETTADVPPSSLVKEAEVTDKKQQKSVTSNAIDEKSLQLQQPKGMKDTQKKQSNKAPKPKTSKNVDEPSVSQLAPSIPPNQPQQTSDLNYARGSMIKVLHVAEKPSIADAIAKGLAAGSIVRRSGKSLPVHEFTNPPFPKAPHAASCQHVVTSVAGHVYSVDFPAQYQSWDAVDPAELFSAPITRKPNQGSVVRHLQTEAKGVDFIVLWMDCDREGENINYEVLDCTMHLMKAGGSAANFDRVYRAHFSAINPSDIQKAYKTLGKPDKNQALCVDARQELDLKVGVAFSRFQTRFFQGQYGDLDSAVLSYGPCQTPTLGFCVQRHIDMETFKPEPFWVLELNVLKRGRSLNALWGSGRSFNRNHVEKLLDQALSSGVAVAQVSDVVTKEKKQGRPIPLNTTALLKACSKALGIGPHAAMSTAERLYLMGYLSYPRTESSAYPKSFDIAETLRQQSSDSRWGSYVSKLLREGHNKSRGGVDMGDHPPITPCRAAGPHELSGDMARVADAVWKSTRVDFTVASLGDKGLFALRGKQIVDPGFLEILLHKEYGDDAEKNVDGYHDADDDEEEDREIPDFAKGEIIPLTNSSSSSNGSKKVAVAAAFDGIRGSLRIKEGVTTPPKYLTESELIGLMERHGIGTDASIATHIENIQKRNYVVLETGRRLRPTRLGLVLVQGYHQIDSSLVLPRVRSDIEGQCNKIAKGEASKDVVVDHALHLFRSKYDLFVKDIQKMNVLFSTSFAKLEDVGKPFTRCGLTRRYLQFIAGPPPRLYNKHTETVYPLPQGGIVKQWSGRSCPVEGCGFELSMYSVGHPERSFPFCPRCYNAPEWALAQESLPEDLEEQEDEAKERQIRRIAGKSMCLECPLPDRHPLIEELTVALDPDSDGVLVVDAHFGPKWRLVSTRAPTIIYLSKSIDNVTVLDERDDAFQVHKMRVEFKANESLLPDKSSKYVCSFTTDETLQISSRVFHAAERTQGGGRGRGRGGRGARGRGGRGGRGGTGRR